LQMADRLQRIEELHRKSSVDLDSSITEAGGSSVSIRSGKRTVEDRSPEAQVTGKNSRLRMDEFSIGETFKKISDGLRKEAGKLIDTVSNKDLGVEDLKVAVKLGMEVMVGNLEAIMNGISDMESQERRTREAEQLKMETKVSSMQEKLEEVKNVCDSLTKRRLEDRNKESRRVMEDKLRNSMAQVKVLDIDFGRIMEDRMEISHMAVELIRESVRNDELKCYDDTMHRSRVSVLGKSTVRRTVNGVGIFTVPILITCRDRDDKWDLEAVIRRAGYFPAYHWPEAMMDWVKEARKEVVNLGYSEASNYIRIRPEVYQGKLQLRGDVKPKSGGQFRIKAAWDAPPADTALWTLIPNLAKPRVIGLVNQARQRRQSSMEDE